MTPSITRSKLLTAGVPDAMDFERIRAHNRTVRLHVVCTMPPYSAARSVVQLFQNFWVQNLEELQKYKQKEVWFHGLTECILPFDRSGMPRAQRTALFTFGTAEAGEVAVEDMPLTKAMCTSEFGTVVKLDAPESVYEAVLDETQAWIAHIGTSKHECNVELLCEDGASWASSRMAKRVCIDLLLHTVDGAGVAKTIVSLFECLTPGLASQTFIAPACMERMCRGEKLLEVQSLASLEDESIRHLIDWVLPISKSRMVITTRMSPERWREEMRRHNGELPKDTKKRLYQIMDADGSIWASTQKQHRLESQADEKEARDTYKNSTHWPKNVLSLLASVKLPPLSDDDLQRWLAQTFAGFLGMPVDEQGSVRWRLEKKCNRQGKWGRRNVNIIFTSEDDAKKAIEETQQIYQHCLTFGAIQWKMSSPHFKLDSVDAVRSSFPRLALADATATVLASRSNEESKHCDFAKRADEYMLLVERRASDDLSCPAIDDIEPEGTWNESFDIAAEDAGPATPISVEAHDIKIGGMATPHDSDADDEPSPSAPLVYDPASVLMQVDSTTGIYRAAQNVEDRGGVVSDVAVGEESGTTAKRVGNFESSPSQVSMSGSPAPKPKNKSRRAQSTVLLAPGPRRLY